MQYKARLDVIRPVIEPFTDLQKQVKDTFWLYTKIEKFLAPYNSRQAGSMMPYMPPARDAIISAIGLQPGRVCLHDATVSAMMSATVAFCEKHKGRKQLILPHHSTLHSCQFQKALFEISEVDVADWKTLSNRNYASIKRVNKIELAGCQPIYIENLKIKEDIRQIKHLIVRQKLGKTGVPSANSWEILLYTNNYGFVIDHADAEINVRYVGMI
jgi:hypothetical protein